MINKAMLDFNLLQFINNLKLYGDVYIVGGYLRDKFFNIESKDIDLTTNIEFNQLKSLLKDYDYKIISDKFQIISLKLQDIKIEIARMRSDISYGKNRNDVIFEFTNNIYLDIKRRDFTINSLMFDGTFFLSYKDTLKDLIDKNLRAIEDANIKFQEDPYRILRGLRLFSEKNLHSIDKMTKMSMQKNAHLVRTLSKDIIKQELIKIIKGENYIETLKILNDLKIFNHNFNINEYQNNYFDRIVNIFNQKNLNILVELKFSKKIIKLINKELL